jgi:hypothetical protein
MTRDDIERMGAGKETDVEILVRIFGYPRKKIFVPEWAEGSTEFYYIPSGKPKRTHMIDAQPVPLFSDSISAAWLIVRHLKAKGLGVSIDDFSDVAGCSILAPVKDGCWEAVAMVRAKTAPEAICKAALILSVSPVDEGGGDS